MGAREKDSRVLTLIFHVGEFVVVFVYERMA